LTSPQTPARTHDTFAIAQTGRSFGIRGADFQAADPYAMHILNSTVTPNNQSVLQATAGLRLGLKSNTLGSPCLSTVVRPEVRTVSGEFSGEESRFVDRGTLDGDEGDREASTWR
jgi:hypothetical protein